MIKKFMNLIGEGISLIITTLFTLVASPVLHLSGADNADSNPTLEDIEKSKRYAEKLHSNGKRYEYW